MGYDAYAYLIQGWRLNDIFEGHCKDEMIDLNRFFQSIHWKTIDGTGIHWKAPNNTGIEFLYDEGILYMGVMTSTGSSRSGPKTISVKVYNESEVLNMIRDLFNVLSEAHITHPLLKFVRDLIWSAPMQNMLILHESY